MSFTWRRTFPDTHHDFFATEGDQEVGRIRRNHGGPNDGTWMWTASGVRIGSVVEVRPLNGEAANRDDAIEALSAAWRRAKAWSARTGRPVG